MTTRTATFNTSAGVAFAVIGGLVAWATSVAIVFAVMH